jgi:hypothetical protein
LTKAWERNASLRLRLGDVGVINEYRRYGRIREGRRDHMRDTAVRLWLGDHLAGKQALPLAKSNAEAAELAALARQQLIRLGRVEAGGGIQLADGNWATAGDLIRARLNVRRGGVARLNNRDTLRIEKWWDRD